MGVLGDLKLEGVVGERMERIRGWVEFEFEVEEEETLPRRRGDVSEAATSVESARLR